MNNQTTKASLRIEAERKGNINSIDYISVVEIDKDGDINQPGKTFSLQCARYVTVKEGPCPMTSELHTVLQ